MISKIFLWKIHVIGKLSTEIIYYYLYCLISLQKKVSEITNNVNKSVNNSNKD